MSSKKLKRFICVALSLGMVCSMNVVNFAADTAISATPDAAAERASQDPAVDGSSTEPKEGGISVGQPQNGSAPQADGQVPTDSAETQEGQNPTDTKNSTEPMTPANPGETFPRAHNE